VPCFGYIVDAWRKRDDKRDGMQRFLIKVAMAMTPAVYVPSERPPPLRLYMVSQGIALYRGERPRLRPPTGHGLSTPFVLHSPRQACVVQASDCVAATRGAHRT
jgi:hypothetical protein